MYKIFFRWLLTLVILCDQAQASLLIDPYVGINVSGSTTFGTNENTYDNVPISMGARVGGSHMGFSLGIDYQVTSGITIENDAKKYDAKDIAIFAGLDLPILLRFYAGYVVSASFEATSAQYDEGSGYKLGLGFTGLPFISINAEYKAVSYDKFNDASITTADHKSVLLGVSLPLKFF